MSFRKICTNFNKTELISVELQFISYSWPDPSRHAIELVVFSVNKKDGDGYSERIVKVLSKYSKNNF